MLRKTIILEIILAIVLGAVAYGFYVDYAKAFMENQAAFDRLAEVRLEEAQTEKEYRELDEELSSLRESVDLKILEIWKRRVAQLQKELE